MDFALSITKRLLPCISFSHKKKKILDQVPLSTIGFDSMLHVISFLDGKSKYNLACANKEFESNIAYEYNWKHCIIDLSSMSVSYAILLLQKYGSLISELELKGSVSPCNRELLYLLIKMHCTNLEFVDSFNLPYIVAVTSSINAFSIPFPSQVSDYITNVPTNTINMMYNTNDTVIQSMDLHNQSLDGFMYSIWQFEIENNLESKYCLTLECCINSEVVGEITIEDSSVASIYAINMLFPVPQCVLKRNMHCLVLSIRCANNLPFGAGHICISSLGRVSFVRERDDVSYIDYSVPSFILF